MKHKAPVLLTVNIRMCHAGRSRRCCRQQLSRSTVKPCRLPKLLWHPASRRCSRCSSRHSAWPGAVSAGSWPPQDALLCRQAANANKQDSRARPCCMQHAAAPLIVGSHDGLYSPEPCDRACSGSPAWAVTTAWTDSLQYYTQGVLGGAKLHVPDSIRQQRRQTITT